MGSRGGGKEAEVENSLFLIGYYRKCNPKRPFPTKQLKHEAAEEENEKHHLEKRRKEREIAGGVGRLERDSLRETLREMEAPFYLYSFRFQTANKARVSTLPPWLQL